MLNKGTPTPQHTSPKKSRFIQKSMLVLAFGLFAGAAAIAVVEPKAEPIVYQAKQTLPLPSGVTPLGLKNSAPFVQQTRIRRGDTLAALLQRLEINAPGLQSFLTHDKNARAIYKLYPGRSVQAAVDENNDLVWLRYLHTPSAKDNGQAVAKWLEVRPHDESYIAEEHSMALDSHTQVAEGVIQSSLFGAADAANIPDAIALQFAEVLGSKIDFIKDIRKGDRFRVIYETYSQHGQTVSSGKILAIEFENQGKVHDAVWFTPEGQSGGYYDFNGHSLEGAFLRNAIKFTRISSTFGGRRHPIHGNWRTHNGVDYAAPTGTPIHATADGEISFIGRQNGYGNVIYIQHHSGYSTVYAHQNKFAAGLKKGDRVSQGQKIGYVGSTGWATGPHLHYEFRVNNKPVDPLAIDLPVAAPLDSQQQVAFESIANQYRTQLAAIKDRYQPALAAAE